VLPFTTEEVWKSLPGKREESVHLALFPARPARAGDLGDWPALLDARAVVTKALEESRAAKLIASSLEARVTVRGGAALLEPLRRHEQASRVFPGNLANLFIVSGVRLEETDGPLAVQVERAPGGKCERCWTWSENVGRLAAHPAVCERCADVLEGKAL
jgi:isoleucyl-tRNA synthetase